MVSLKGEFWQSVLLRFSARREVWRSRQDHDNELLVLAVIAAITGIVLYALGGYHAAFSTLDDFGAMIMPDIVWANITFLGDTVTALSIAALISYRHPHLVLATIVAALICGVTIQLAKHGFSAPRPPAALPSGSFHTIGPAYRSNSFPSGHTATGFLMFGLLTRTVRTFRWRLCLYAAAVLVGWSRVVCGVHWPVDVAVGAVIGSLSAYIGLRVSDRWTLKLTSYLPLSALLLFAAADLFVFRGHMEPYTEWTAPILGAIVIVFWFGAWVHFWWRRRARQHLNQS